jgi:hypothetical protein
MLAMTCELCLYICVKLAVCCHSPYCLQQLELAHMKLLMVSHCRVQLLHTLLHAEGDHCTLVPRQLQPLECTVLSCRQCTVLQQSAQCTAYLCLNLRLSALELTVLKHADSSMLVP